MFLDLTELLAARRQNIFEFKFSEPDRVYYFYQSRLDSAKDDQGENMAVLVFGFHEVYGRAQGDQAGVVKGEELGSFQG